MIVLAFDPGKTIGVALVDFRSARPLLISFDATDIGGAVYHINFESHCADEAKPVIAIETNAYHARSDRPFSPAHLINAARIGGELAGYARGLGLTVIEASALEWRLAIVGKRNASDAEVKAALSRLIDLPRTNAHVRDAIGLALYAERRIRLGSADRDLKPDNVPKPWKPKRRRAA